MDPQENPLPALPNNPEDAPPPFNPIPFDLQNFWAAVNALVNSQQNQNIQLQQLSNILQHQLQNPPVPAPNPGRRAQLAPPTPFKGKPWDVDRFLSDINDHLLWDAASFTTDQERILYIASYLPDNSPGKVWFSGIRRQEPEVENNLQLFLTRFRSHFRAVNAADYAMEKILKLEHTRLGGGADYCATFRSLVINLVISEETKCQLLWDNVHPDVKMAIGCSTGKPRTFEEMESRILDVDQFLYENKRDERKRAFKKRTQSQLPQPQQLQQAPSPPSTSNPAPMEVDMVRFKKLTPSERDRRLKNNLCLYCGNAGHIRVACPEAAKYSKRRRTTAQVNAASIEELSDIEDAASPVSDPSGKGQLEA